MKILDLDLDFFVSDIKGFLDNNHKRLDSKKYIAWSKEEFDFFLINNCKLSKNYKYRGKVFEEHHECYYWWRNLIRSGILKTPFKLVHVDAHTDLGFGNLSLKNIQSELLCLPVNDRILYDRDINCGNFLVYAIANRWISEFKYIIHPKWGGNDLMDMYFKDFNSNTRMIQLKQFSKKDVDDFTTLNKYKVISYEPEVPFNVMYKEDYQENEEFDFISLSRSKYYTPETADKLIDVFKQYIF